MVAWGGGAPRCCHLARPGALFPSWGIAGQEDIGLIFLLSIGNRNMLGGPPFPMELFL